MKTIFTLFLSLVFFASFGQKTTGSITGQVTDDNGKALFSASISLSTKTGTVVKGTISDSTGTYKFEKLKDGEYLLSATMLGYSSAKSEAITITNGSTESAKLLVLNAAAGSLHSVTVTAQKKLYEMQPDKMVMNIENSILATGNTAFDVLKKAPAVTTDKDDNILLKGAAVAIYIDGKISYLSGAQLSEYLKSLPADAISKIEIITNPSSKYDAAGSAGIINIKLKKNTANGLNGTASISLGKGRYQRGNTGAALNYRNNKINIFGSGYFGYSESYNQLTYNSVITNTSGTSYQDRENYWHPKTLWGNFKTGVDYSITKNSTIGFLINGNSSSSKTRTDNSTIFNDAAHTPESSIITESFDTGRYNNITYNVNYKATLDTAGSELNIDADYAQYKNRTYTENTNRFWGTKNEIARDPYIFRTIQPADIKVKSFKADYTYYFKNKLKMEVGGKISFVETDNNMTADSLLSGKWTTDYNRSNRFIYKENINAAYVTLSKAFGNTNIQAGLRAEQTNSTGNSITLNRIDKRNYLDFFPTLFITQKLNDKNEINFSYTRRIRRPGYQSLNPFVSYMDPYTYFEGNPFLKPSYTNSVEVKYGFKQFLFFSLSYRHATDVMTSVIRQNQVTGVTTNTTENANSSDDIRLNVTASMPLTKWWNSDNNLSIAYGKEKSAIKDFEYDQKAFGAGINSSNTFTLVKGFRLQADVYYYTPSRDGLTKTKSSYSVDLGVQKQIMNKKATIKFTASNVIGPSAYRAQIQSDMLNTNWVNKWEGRRYTLSFSYKFGNKNVKANRSRSTASQDEKNRL
ncbi:MAG: TonB-dependent receptor [Filimonas sp.]|nr:TonB-dependent receptor [Filimonas sp.]